MQSQRDGHKRSLHKGQIAPQQFIAADHHSTFVNKMSRLAWVTCSPCKSIWCACKSNLAERETREWLDADSRRHIEVLLETSTKQLLLSSMWHLARYMNIWHACIKLWSGPPCCSLGHRSLGIHKPLHQIEIGIKSGQFTCGSCTHIHWIWLATLMETLQVIFFFLENTLPFLSGKHSIEANCGQRSWDMLRWKLK